MKLKIAIAAHGRFHAFDLTRELINIGHDVTLLTPYPKFYTKKFGIPNKNVISFKLYGIKTRFFHKLYTFNIIDEYDSKLKPIFTRLVSKQLQNRQWDIVIYWSSVGLEILKNSKIKTKLKICFRGSAHIQTQYDILAEEESRAGTSIEKPNSWNINREIREYNLSDLICTNSIFSYNSFLLKGFSDKKLINIPLGVDISNFEAKREEISTRIKRILCNKQLKIINVGTISFQKGVYDWIQIINKLKNSNFDFTFVGPISKECKEIVSNIKDKANFIGKIPQNKLTNYYKDADLFILPTIHDGFGLVITQALSSGIPVITTENSGGPDHIKEGYTGWIVPIRQPKLIIDRLKWCHNNRIKLAKMVVNNYKARNNLDWSKVAEEFVTKCSCVLKNSDSQ